MTKFWHSLIISSFLMLYIGLGCISPTHARVQEEIVVAFDSIDQLIEREKLQEALTKLKNISPRNKKIEGEVKIRIGQIYLRLGKPAKALAFFEAANFLTFDNSQSYLGIAQSMLLLGRLTQARKHAKNALRADPDLIAAELVIAKLEDRAGQVEIANHRFKELLTNQPKNEDLIVTYAKFLSDRNDYHLAIKVLKQFILKTPLSAGAVDTLGQIYWLNGEKEKAITHRKAAAKLYASQDNLFRSNTILTWIEQINSLATKPLKRAPFSNSKKKKNKTQHSPERVEKQTPQNQSSQILARPEPIKIPQGSSVTQGSGFIIDRGTRVVTNFHVISGAKEIIIRSGSGEVRNAKIFATSQANDLAVLLLETPYPKHYAIPFDRMGDPRPGRSAVVMGYPLGTELGIHAPSLTEGIVSKVYRSGENRSKFQVTAKLNKGNSGGPVFDRRGNLIGIAVAKLDTTAYFKKKGYLPEDVNFAVKISRMFELVHQEVPDGSQLASVDRDLEALYEMTLPSVVLIISVLDVAQR